MKKILVTLTALAVCGCSHSKDEIDLDVYDTEVEGHTYLIFEAKNGTISVLHSPDCETCKNKINGETYK